MCDERSCWISSAFTLLFAPSGRHSVSVPMQMQCIAAILTASLTYCDVTGVEGGGPASLPQATSLCR